MKLLHYQQQAKEIISLKEMLKNLGYTITDNLPVPLKTAEDEFGAETLAAVINFQRQRQLIIDGIVGDITWKALKKANNKESNDITHILYVPYFSQRDNKYLPYVSCNVTCLAMLMIYYKMVIVRTSISISDLRKEICAIARQFGVKELNDDLQLEDILYLILDCKESQNEMKRIAKWAVGKYRPHNVHVMLDWCLQQCGVKYETKVMLYDDILNEIQNGNPVLLSGKFTVNGHIILAVGKTEQGDLICHDPWGNWLENYKSNNMGYLKSGEFVIYPKELLLNTLNKDSFDSYLCHSLSV